MRNRSMSVTTRFRGTARCRDVLGVERAPLRCFDSSSRFVGERARGAAMVGIAVFRRSNVLMIASARTSPSNGKS